jgi:putative ABC transport system permease protein
VVLVAGLAVALGLPAFTWSAAAVLEAEMLARATATPLLIGYKGNEFDLTLAALSFRGEVRDPIPAGTAKRVAGYGLAVPLIVGHTVSGAPLVGTAPEYFDARGLRLAIGRRPALLGEVVAGAEVARRFRLSPGDQLRSDLANLYNLAGSYPLVLTVTGIFEPASSADDLAFFADTKTIWTIDGRLHGHEPVTSTSAQGGDDENLEASAAIFLVQEITDRNRGTFHLHGDPDAMPVSAVLLFPRDARARDQVLGDLALHPTEQAVEPELVVREILDIVLRVRDALAVFFGVIALTTLAFVALILMLSLRLRAAELSLVVRIGAARGTVAAMVGVELGLVLLLATLVATGGVWAGVTLIRAWAVG